MRRLLLLLLALTLGVPVLLIGAFYAYENWTGAAALRSTLERLRVRGEPLTAGDLRPADIPDAENMAAAPVFRELFTFNSSQRASVNGLQVPRAKTFESTLDPDRLGAFARRFRADFSGGPAAAAHVVLDGLAPMEPLLEAIKLAASRPAVVWPVNFDRGAAAPMPFLAPLRRTAEVLSARAMVSLVRQEPESAREDFLLIARLSQASRPAAFASGATEQAMIGHALNVVQDGLTLGSWSDEDLSVIQKTLAKFHPLETFRRSVQGERALFLTSPGDLSARVKSLFTFVDFRTPASRWITSTLSQLAWNLRPSGWNARDRADYAAYSQDWLEVLIHNGYVRPWALADWSERLRTLRNYPLSFFRTPLTGLVLPTFATAARQAAYTQTRVDLARVACAIERYRRDRGAFPENLDALTPEWIPSVPRDPVGGGRYFYRPLSEAAFILYGRGWNARDDGGSRANLNPLLGPPSADDWVWEFAPAGPRAAALPQDY